MGLLGRGATAAPSSSASVMATRSMALDGLATGADAGANAIAASPVPDFSAWSARSATMPQHPATNMADGTDDPAVGPGLGASSAADASVNISGTGVRSVVGRGFSRLVRAAWGSEPETGPDATVLPDDMGAESIFKVSDFPEPATLVPRATDASALEKPAPAAKAAPVRGRSATPPADPPLTGPAAVPVPLASSTIQAGSVTTAATAATTSQRPLAAATPPALAVRAPAASKGKAAARAAAKAAKRSKKGGKHAAKSAETTSASSLPPAPTDEEREMDNDIPAMPTSAQTVAVSVTVAALAPSVSTSPVVPLADPLEKQAIPPTDTAPVSTAPDATISPKILPAETVPVGRVPTETTPAERAPTVEAGVATTRPRAAAARVGLVVDTRAIAHGAAIAKAEVGGVSAASAMRTPTLVTAIAETPATLTIAASLGAPVLATESICDVREHPGTMLKADSTATGTAANPTASPVASPTAIAQPLSEPAVAASPARSMASAQSLTAMTTSIRDPGSARETPVASSTAAATTPECSRYLSALTVADAVANAVAGVAAPTPVPVSPAGAVVAVTVASSAVGLKRPPPTAAISSPTPSLTTAAALTADVDAHPVAFRGAWAPKLPTSDAGATSRGSIDATSLRSGRDSTHSGSPSGGSKLRKAMGLWSSMRRAVRPPAGASDASLDLEPLADASMAAGTAAATVARLVSAPRAATSPLSGRTPSPPLNARDGDGDGESLPAANDRGPTAVTVMRIRLPPSALMAELSPTMTASPSVSACALALERSPSLLSLGSRQSTISSQGRERRREKNGGRGLLPQLAAHLARPKPVRSRSIPLAMEQVFESPSTSELAVASGDTSPATATASTPIAPMSRTTTIVASASPTIVTLPSPAFLSSLTVANPEATKSTDVTSTDKPVPALPSEVPSTSTSIAMSIPTPVQMFSYVDGDTMLDHAIVHVGQQQQQRRSATSTSSGPPPSTPHDRHPTSPPPISPSSQSPPTPHASLLPITRQRWPLASRLLSLQIHAPLRSEQASTTADTVPPSAAPSTAESIRFDNILAQQTLGFTFPESAHGSRPTTRGSPPLSSAHRPTSGSGLMPMRTARPLPIPPPLAFLRSSRADSPSPGAAADEAAAPVVAIASPLFVTDTALAAYPTNAPVETARAQALARAADELIALSMAAWNEAPDGIQSPPSRPAPRPDARYRVYDAVLDGDDTNDGDDATAAAAARSGSESRRPSTPHFLRKVAITSKTLFRSRSRSRSRSRDGGSRRTSTTSADRECQTDEPAAEPLASFAIQPDTLVDHSFRSTVGMASFHELGQSLPNMNVLDFGHGAPVHDMAEPREDPVAPAPAAAPPVPASFSPRQGGFAVWYSEADFRIMPDQQCCAAQAPSGNDDVLRIVWPDPDPDIAVGHDDPRVVVDVATSLHPTSLSSVPVREGSLQDLFEHICAPNINFDDLLPLSAV